MINKILDIEKLLLFDGLIWIIFGLLCYIIPDKLLSMITFSMEYDSIHIHMMRALAIFIFLNGLISFKIYQEYEEYKVDEYFNYNINNLMKMKILAITILLFTQIYYNFTSEQLNKNHIFFGIFGLIISLVIPILILIMNVNFFNQFS